MLLHADTANTNVHQNPGKNDSYCPFLSSHPFLLETDYLAIRILDLNSNSYRFPNKNPILSLLLGTIRNNITNHPPITTTGQTETDSANQNIFQLLHSSLLPYHPDTTNYCKNVKGVRDRFSQSKSLVATALVFFTGPSRYVLQKEQ